MTFIDEQPRHPRQIGSYYCLMTLCTTSTYQVYGSVAFNYSPLEGHQRGMYLKLERVGSAQESRDFFIEQAQFVLSSSHPDCEWHVTPVPPDNPEDANEGAYAFVIRIYKKESTDA